MKKIVIFGNSASGKSTLARTLANRDGLAHLDLDTIAWQAVTPPERMPIEESLKLIQQFIQAERQWVVEGCYGDLLELLLPYASELVFLNLPVALCVENAKNRPWEPHKYESQAAQDANLAMLIAWITQYETRDDAFSKAYHERLFTNFSGTKTMLTSNERSQA